MNIHSTTIKPFRVLPALLILALPGLGFSEEGGDELPDAGALLQAHLEAVGGREAVRKQDHSTMKGKFEMPESGLAGSLVVASRPDNDRISIIDLENFGEIRAGYAPELAWSVDPFMGPRILEGEELEAQAEQNETGAILREDSHVSAMETVERTEMGGTECYRVRVEWKSGRETHDCYSVEDAYLVAVEFKQPSPMGEIESITLMQDYREFDDVIVPTRMVVATMGQEQVLTIESVQLGQADEELFKRPESIKTLMADRPSED